MIQEIFPHCFNNTYIANKNIADSDFVLHYNGNSLLLKTNGDEYRKKKIFRKFQIKQKRYSYSHLIMSRAFLCGIA